MKGWVESVKRVVGIQDFIHVELKITLKDWKDNKGITYGSIVDVEKHKKSEINGNQNEQLF